jgi:hypothetical protein
VEPHIHLSGLSIGITCLEVFIALLVWRLLQLALKNTPLGPPVSFVLH